jgi:hypothetical protein
MEASMHKTLLSVGVMVLFGAALTGPASAQMCGAGQQAQASSSGGMMCGAPIGAAATENPTADKPAQKSTGMCPCCRNMAMMKGGGMMQHHNMPGMDMPKQ